jgi:CHAD domain-containing protein
MTNTNHLTAHAAEQTVRLLKDAMEKMTAAVQCTDPETVHQLRVALRRCRQALQMARGSKNLNQPRWDEILTSAGEVRNRDIAVSRLQAEGDEADRDKVDQAPGLVERLLIQREQFADQLRTTIADYLNGQPHLACDARGDAPSRLRKLAQKYLRVGREAANQDSSAHQLHRFRLVAKRLRYSLELFQSFNPKALAEVIAELRTIQTCLGDANDCRTIRKMLRHLSTGDATTDRLSRQLKQQQKRKIAQFLECWTKSLGHARDRRAWLGNLNPLFEPNQTG